MPDITFTPPDLTSFACLDDLGPEETGQSLEPDRVVLACRVVDPDGWCHRCGCQGLPRDTVIRRLTHETFASFRGLALTPVPPTSRMKASEGKTGAYLPNRVE